MFAVDGEQTGGGLVTTISAVKFNSNCIGLIGKSFSSDWPELPDVLVLTNKVLILKQGSKRNNSVKLTAPSAH